MIKDLSLLMRQAQDMQKKMQELRERLARMEVTGVSGGGMVKVVCSGDGKARRVEIAPALFSGEDKTTVEDLITAAINDARDKTQQQTQGVMQELGQDLGQDLGTGQAGDMPFPLPK